MNAIVDTAPGAPLLRVVEPALASGLHVSQLQKSFGAFKAVDDVSVKLAPGEVKAIIGPNGAGKSTLFSCLAGTLMPDAGHIHLNGEDITYRSVEHRAGRGLVKSFQITSIFPQMTVWDNVLAAATGVARWHVMDLFRTSRSRPDIEIRAAEALKEVKLHHRRNVVSATLSHGEQRKLEVALALASGAEILLLDEPTAGMGIDDIREFVELVGRLRTRRGILLVEHNMDIVLGLSDRVTVMAHGKVICEGTPQQVRHDTIVREAYLGHR
jgi:branched-chain amino acid transport system ATP-binding protein